MQDTYSFEDLVGDIGKHAEHEAKRSAQADPVGKWLQDETYFDAKARPCMDHLTTEIRERYNNWAVRNDYPQLSAMKFTSEMRKKGWPVKSYAKLLEPGKFKWSITFAGLRFKSDAREERKINPNYVYRWRRPPEGSENFKVALNDTGEDQ